MSTKNYIAYFGIRLVVILLVAYAFNQIYTKVLWEKDLHKYDAHVLLDLLERQDTAEIFYLGESSNFSINEKDTQRLSISHLINQQLEDRVATLNKGAYHAGIFYDLINRISSPSVHTIIVTLNMRTLNQATIHAGIETALQKQARFFKNAPPLYNRILHYVKAYAFHIKEEGNPRIDQLDDIADLCKDKGYKLVFNLLAENTEYADSLAGESLVWLMRANRDLLVNRYQSKGVIVVDNLESVRGIDYTDQHWTTEHYNEIGRQQIADNVVKALISEK